MCKNRPLIVAGVVFALVALLHLARVYYSVPVMFGTMAIPESWSVIGFFVAAFLSLWMFISARK